MAKNVIKLSGTIAQWDISANYVQRELDRISGDVEIQISTYGGDFYEGVGIYNAIREYSKNKGEVTTVVTSKAMSAGSHIFLAGDKRFAYSNSTIMCHCAWSMAIGDTHEMVRQSRILDSIDNIQANLYKKFQNKEVVDIKAEMRNEMWYIGEQELLASGFVTEIIQVDSLPTALNVANKRYANAMAKYKTSYMEQDIQEDFDKIEASIQSCMGDCPLATVPSAMVKTGNSENGGKPVSKKDEINDSQVTDSPTPEDKTNVEASQKTEKEIRAEEAQRIQAVDAVIPKSFKENDKVKTALFDPETTPQSMKALLFDLDQETKKAEADKNTPSEDDINALNGIIPTSVAPKTEETEGSSMAAVGKMFGGKK